MTFQCMPGGALPGTVFVSAGTWVLVGMERSEPDTSPQARQANFSNEAGAFGGVRFLKNVVGLWILEQCRQAWGAPPIEQLLEEAADLSGPVPTFDAGDHRFVSPVDMVKEVEDAAQLEPGSPRSVISRTVIESIVEGIADVVDELRAIDGVELGQLAVVGGGSRVPLMHELLSERARLPVIRGSQEATALGNALAQGLAIGVFDDLTQAREWVGAGVPAGGLNVGRDHGGEAE
jgi:rhamnulokinase